MTSRLAALCWLLSDALLRLFAPAQAEAVRGDLLESGDSAAAALRGVLGLALRRQLAAASSPRPWLVFLLGMLPTALLLAVVSGRAAALGSVYLWLAVDNARMSLLATPGYWYALWDVLPSLLLALLALICWAWTAGFAVAALHHRAGIARTGIARPASAKGAFFSCVLVASVCAAPALNTWLLPGIPPVALNAAVFAHIRYWLVLPALLFGAAVLLPALHGLRSGRIAVSFAPQVRSLLWPCAALGICSLIGQVLPLGQFHIPPLFAAATPLIYHLARRAARLSATLHPIRSHPS